MRDGELDCEMKVFYCDGCGALVFFENVQCLQCGRKLGFVPELLDATALEPSGDRWRAISGEVKGRIYKECANGLQHGICNWLVPDGEEETFCAACRLNAVIPNLNDLLNLERWRKLEIAKRRIIYTLLKLGLPLEGDCPKGHEALRFSFLCDTPGSPSVMTGHADGLITINAIEADDAERERRRVDLREPFRTLLGHLRHEIAHYYWDVLISGGSEMERFRAVFGDERIEYNGALQRYYKQGPPNDWMDRFVSAYASSHPWEDWAETWAHYLHIVDTMETAAGFGLRLRPRQHPAAHMMTSHPERVEQLEGNFEMILENWVPLTYALNSLNRSMGLPDLYPFILPAAAVNKLKFVHEVVTKNKCQN